jgi:predicted secreted hydrolase
MTKWLMGVVGVLVVIGLFVFGLNRLQRPTVPSYSANVISALSDTSTAGYERAVDVRDFHFPQDYGAHPNFQTEWWYYTGNLSGADGRRFGYEFTIFRRALNPSVVDRVSDWGTTQLYFADLAITDVQGNHFYSTERFSRGAVGLSGADISPKVRIWINNWAMTAQNDRATTMHLQADAGTDAPVALDLTTQETKPPTLEGDRGLSAKSSATGNASYYYSLTRLDTSGTLTINGQPFTVSGLSWMDHEFSTSGLDASAVGWDWFSLQLSDKREVMLYHIRRADGTDEPTNSGTLVNADGTSEHLALNQFSIEPLATWKSPFTGATYPAKWKVTVRPASGAPIVLTVTPLLADQELRAAAVYWEGASQLIGDQGGTPITGYGYVELTGYNQFLNEPSMLPGMNQSSGS